MDPPEDWYDLFTIIAYLTQGADHGTYEVPHLESRTLRMEWQVRRIIGILTPYYGRICDLFQPATLEETKGRLAQFGEQQALEKDRRHVIERQETARVALPKRRIIRHGVWLGVLADLLSAVLFWLGVAICTYLTDPPYGEAYISFEAYILALILGTFVALLLPAMAGGAVVALVFTRLRGRPHLLWTMILVGAATAILVVLVAFLVLTLVLGPFREGWVVFVAWLLAIGIPVGGWHGWRMVEWLRRQEQATGETE